jgi:hypothetical protein
MKRFVWHFVREMSIRNNLNILKCGPHRIAATNNKGIHHAGSPLSPACSDLATLIFKCNFAPISCRGQGGEGEIMN